MNSNLIIVIACCVLATFVCELVLWTMFFKKMKPISFPHELDTSYFRFFSLARLRISAIVHSIFVACVLAVFCTLLW